MDSLCTKRSENPSSLLLALLSRDCCLTKSTDLRFAGLPHLPLGWHFQPLLTVATDDLLDEVSASLPCQGTLRVELVTTFACIAMYCLFFSGRSSYFFTLWNRVCSFLSWILFFTKSHRDSLFLNLPFYSGFLFIYIMTILA